jgi:hypothetical protein
LPAYSADRWVDKWPALAASILLGRRAGILLAHLFSFKIPQGLSSIACPARSFTIKLYVQVFAGVRVSVAAVSFSLIMAVRIATTVIYATGYWLEMTRINTSSVKTIDSIGAPAPVMAHMI